MVKATLVEEEKAAGKEFLALTDKASIDIRAALWTYRESGEYWWLMLASPIVDEEGPTALYHLILPFWYQVEKPEWSDVTAVGLNDKLIRMIGSQVHTTPEKKPFWFGPRVIEGTWVDECYIYRMNV